MIEIGSFQVYLLLKRRTSHWVVKIRSSTFQECACVLKWESLPRKPKNRLTSLGKCKIVEAVAVSVAPPAEDNAENRQELCREYGFGKIGEPWMSIAHWLIWHFDLRKFKHNQVNRVKLSVACVFAFMAIGWPLIIYKTGIIGWIKFWLMPWLGYHFWMSTFTMVHHTSPHIPFESSEEWNAAQAQLNGTIHCDYPSW